MKPSKHQVTTKIDFLETQLSDLNHYLPKSYEYLLEQLDQQKRLLAELEVQETFQAIDSSCTTDPGSRTECS
jgi:DNA repair ATPase RecN